MFQVTKTLVLVALAMACAACGGGDEVFTEPCVVEGAGVAVATHDFGTQDPGTLARVTAYEDIVDAGHPWANPSTAPNGQSDDQEISFRNGVARVTCLSSANSVTFVLTQ
jgi:hypothetical protein